MNIRTSATLVGITAASILPFTVGIAAPAHAETFCSNDVRVGPGTSCDFGQAVAAAYLGSRGGDLFANPGGQVVATSPVTGQSYTMTCTLLRQSVECTGGNGAEVLIV